MRKLVLLPILCFLSIISNAQEKEGFKIGVGGSVVIPASNLEFNSTGGGVDILVSYGLSKNFIVTADGGFSGLPGNSVIPSKVGLVPIRAGIRYVPIPKLYLAAKAGLGILTIIEKSTNYTTFSLGAGYNITRHFDAGASFDGYTNSDLSFSTVNIRLGYRFSIK